MYLLNTFWEETGKLLADVVTCFFLAWPCFYFGGICCHFPLPTLCSAIPQGNGNSVETSCSFLFLYPCLFPFAGISLPLSSPLSAEWAPGPPLKWSSHLIWAALSPLYFLCSFNMQLCFSCLLHCSIFPFTSASKFWLDWGSFSSRTVFHSSLYPQYMSQSLAFNSFVINYYLFILVLSHNYSINIFECFTMS